MLGLGLGLSKGTNLLSNLKLLTRNSDWAIWGDKATGTSKGLNSPATNPIQDLVGNADGTLQGFAFTPASGYVDVVAPNGKTVTGIQGDAVNDVILLGSNAPNPVGTQDFGFAFVFKTGAILSYRCIASRVGTGLADAQWDLTLGSDNKLYFATGAISTVSNPIINENTFYKVLLIRKNGRLYIKINNTTDKDVANIVDLPQKNNTRLLARSSNADGSTNNAFFNGILCYADYNNGDNIDAWEVDQNKAIAKIYGL